MSTSAPCPEDYCAAALRHDRDARLLRRHGAHDNAAYLAGYVIECVFKALLEGSELSPRPYRHDLRRLTGEALWLAAVLSPGLRRYPLDELVAVRQASKVWSVDLRYCRDNALSEAQRAEVADGAREAIERILSTLILDGKATLSA